MPFFHSRQRDDCSRESPAKTVYPKTGDETSFFCRVLVRVSVDFCPVLLPECLLREFPCQKPFTGRFPCFCSLFVFPVSEPVRPALLRFPR